MPWLPGRRAANHWATVTHAGLASCLAVPPCPQPPASGLELQDCCWPGASHRLLRVQTPVLPQVVKCCQSLVSLGPAKQLPRDWWGKGDASPNRMKHGVRTCLWVGKAPEETSESNPHSDLGKVIPPF